MPLADWFDRLGGLTHVHGNLHRSPLPYTRAHFEALRAGGIDVIYSMEEAIPGRLAEDMGFDWRPHFWTDDAPPTPKQMTAFLDDLRSLPTNGRVLVHCKAGWGRTGSALVCALVDRGMGTDEALRHFWSRVPPARSVMDGNGQTEFVRGFTAARRGRGLY